MLSAGRERGPSGRQARGYRTTQAMGAWTWVLAAEVLGSEVSYYRYIWKVRPTRFDYRLDPETQTTLLRSFAVNGGSGEPRRRLGGTCVFLGFVFGFGYCFCLFV